MTNHPLLNYVESPIYICTDMAQGPCFRVYVALTLKYRYR